MKQTPQIKAVLKYTDRKMNKEISAMEKWFKKKGRKYSDDFWQAHGRYTAFKSLRKYITSTKK